MLRLLGYGKSNQQIAEEVVVQFKTVRNKLTAIYQKLGLKNRNEALLYYWGILHTLCSTETALERRVGEPEVG